MASSSDDEAPEAVSQSTARDFALQAQERETSARNRADESNRRKHESRQRNRKAPDLLPADVLEALTESEDGSVTKKKRRKTKKKKKKNHNVPQEYERDGFHIVVNRPGSKQTSGRSIKFDDSDDFLPITTATPNAALDFMAQHFSKKRLRRGNNLKGTSAANQKHTHRRSQI